MAVEFTPEFRQKYILSVQGKEFITYAGLMHLRQELGTVQSIETQLLQAPNKDNGEMAIAWAKVTMKDGTSFEDHGDCDDKNCSKMIAPHKIRMATTRAKGRALREALGVTILMSDEMTSLFEHEDEMTADQMNVIARLVKEKGIDRDTGRKLFQQVTGKTGGLAGASKQEAQKMINFLTSYDPKVHVALADSSNDGDPIS